MGSQSRRKCSFHKCLPAEVADHVFWWLDLVSLGRATCTCRSWLRIARDRHRWESLCETDWGIRQGTWQDYQNWLHRWKGFRSVVASWKGNGCPSGVCSSIARKRLFDALGVLAELGFAVNPRARH